MGILVAEYSALWISPQGARSVSKSSMWQKGTGEVPTEKFNSALHLSRPSDMETDGYPI